MILRREGERGIMDWGRETNQVEGKRGEGQISGNMSKSRTRTKVLPGRKQKEIPL